MAKYSFKQECDKLDTLAKEMRENLQHVRFEATYETIRAIAFLAKRMMRKVEDYENFYDYATAVGGSECSIQKPLPEPVNNVDQLEEDEEPFLDCTACRHFDCLMRLDHVGDTVEKPWCRKKEAVISSDDPCNNFEIRKEEA